MIVFGIDPGPESCGVAFYDTEARRTEVSRSDMPVETVLEEIRSPAAVDLVAIERVQSYGIAGSTLLRTSEIVGRLWQQATSCRLPVLLLYRREILRVLDVTGKGNRDALVRQRLIETHGGTRQAAQGLKKSPGPLYGVSGHAWQALAVAIAAAGRPLV